MHLYFCCKNLIMQYLHFLYIVFNLDFNKFGFSPIEKKNND